ncbi:hypothetical protein GGTG_09426 [Gaeumannomyces tritici R3-111a-1]|uniref:EF-hand domain-containing protein n=1 Tax=Gaeumannomyces tritici (strain R3-111a-1) TaxID=644352 RepID=J3P7D3_GAET3|nr:hypothetical protein GGTG_09426 [Gaeumannomyces tritici R3-111a-1]EJT72564.1 hypothetical protein GGTG_09426 [Gaeumannomyces tritici R3-111a-1]
MAATPTSTFRSSFGGGGSARNSPFRRPESPASPSPLRQQHTTPHQHVAPMASPPRLGSITPSSAIAGSRFAYQSTATLATGGHLSSPFTPKSRSSGGGDSVTTPTNARPNLKSVAPRTMSSNTAMSQLPPSQMRMLREGFQILDRDSDGTVGREDVADMLGQLGLPANPSDVSAFFPLGSSSSTSLAVFLSSLSSVLAAMSPSAELLSAFSAFDDDDSGQVDLAELRDALLNTAPEPGERPLTEDEIDRVMDGFTGRRAFSKNNSRPGGLSKRGEVFRYQDFVHSIVGGNGNPEAAAEEDDSS